jgi:hypothetical protein
MYEENRCAHRVLVGTPEGKRPLEDAGVEMKIILKWILRNRNGDMD